jgi:hypothetical protein
MNAATKLSAFGLALVVVAGGAWAVGSAVGPLDQEAAPTNAAGGVEHGGGHDAPPAGPAADAGLPGLAVAANGYRLELTRTRLTPGVAEPFRFRILGSDGAALTRFDIEHDKRLHLVVVRRDGSRYQHLHPELAADGTWSVDLALPDAGSYRVLTDFKPEGGAKTTLGADVEAPGPYQPESYGPMWIDTVDDYEIRLAGDLVPGQESTVTATVTRGGAAVTDLQPYLGAYGHLVALRAADLGYLHVHPLGTPGDGVTAAGPDVRFAVEVPTPGRYRLFLDFQHGGTVRTAEFTVDTGAHSAATPHGHG